MPQTLNLMRRFQIGPNASLKRTSGTQEIVESPKVGSDVFVESFRSKV